MSRQLEAEEIFHRGYTAALAHIMELMEAPEFNRQRVLLTIKYLLEHPMPEDFE
jgi:hypothetical protein